MSDFQFFVDVLDSAGNKLGTGPLASLERWTYTARFDRAGQIGASFAATDPQTEHVSNRRILRAHALLNGQWREVGAGVIDQVETMPRSDGRVNISVGGLDLMRELSYRNVGKLEIGNLVVDEPVGTTHSAAVATLEALAPDGWQFYAAGDPPNDTIYALYDGESVLGASVMLAEKTQTHFYRGEGRNLYFAGEWTSSGIRAIQATNLLTPNTCAISSLRRSVETHDLLTRIHPYGAGADRESSLTLKATTRTAPPGYTLNKTENYIEKIAATATYGLIDFPYIEFKDVAPISNTFADVQAASNMLYDLALHELNRRSQLADQETFAITVDGCSALLRPLQTIRMIYRDLEQGIDIDRDLYILEATWEMTPRGINTTSLVVSTDDRWPDSDESAAAERAAQGRIFAAHPQMSINEWWENGTLFVGSDQATHIAEFPFVLGNAVAAVLQVLFRFRVTQVLSFTSVVVASSTTSDPSSEDSSDASSETTTDASNTSTTPSGGGSTSDVSATSVLNHSHSVEVSGLSVVSGSPVYFNTTNGLHTASGAGLQSGPGTTLRNLTAHTHPTPNHTHNIDHNHDMPHIHGIEHTHEVTPEIGVGYGVYQAPVERTYALEDLEYAINGGAWVSCDSAAAVGDDYYEVDITEDVSDTVDFTFLPYHENNLVEIRRKDGISSIALAGSHGLTTHTQIDTTPVEHGIGAGEPVTIVGTTYHDGQWTVTEVQNEYIFFIDQTGDSHSEGAVGSVEIGKSAMIYAKLGIRTKIQAITLG